jgi:hypothetical protein
MASQTAICNRALECLGDAPIVSINADVKAAKALKRVYNDTLKAFLVDHPWHFAKKRASLPASATSPAWGFTYGYPVPADFLRLLAVRNGPDFSLEADDSGSQWILTEAAAPLDILYVASITDAGRLPPHAVEALARWLAYDVCEDLTNSNTKKQDAATALGIALSKAKRINGLQKAAGRLSGLHVPAIARPKRDRISDFDHGRLMVRASPNLNTFDAGEFAPITEGRTDLSRYGFACRILENFLPRVVGPASRRPGSSFIASTRYPDRVATLVRFEYSTEQAYALEFGDLYVRFYRNDGPLLEAAKAISNATQANPVVLSIAGHGYSNGEDFEVSGVVGMTQLNGRRFRVANKTANTVELQDQHGTNIDGTAFTAYASGGNAYRVYTLTTTYQEADLTQLKFAQSADVLYITHTEYVPRKLQRYGATNWVLSQIDFQDGPYLPQNGNPAITLAKSAVSGAGITISSAYTKTATGMANNGAGAIRVTSANHGYKTGDHVDITGTTGTTEANGTWYLTRVNANAFDLNGSTFVNAWLASGVITPHIFEATDLGRLIRIQDSSTWGYAKIVTYVSAVNVTADVLSNFGATAASGNWRLGLYSQGGGYPSCVTFYEGRLFFGGCPLTPTRVDGSQSSNYESSAPRPRPRSSPTTTRLPIRWIPAT